MNRKTMWFNNSLIERLDKIPVHQRVFCIAELCKRTVNIDSVGVPVPLQWMIITTFCAWKMSIKGNYCVCLQSYQGYWQGKIKQHFLLPSLQTLVFLLKMSILQLYNSECVGKHTLFVETTQVCILWLLKNVTKTLIWIFWQNFSKYHISWKISSAKIPTFIKCDKL